MTTCRTCQSFAEPFEPRGPALERVARGCKPAAVGEVPAHWPHEPDEPRECEHYCAVGIRIVDLAVPDSRELSRRLNNPDWRRA